MIISTPCSEDRPQSYINVGIPSRFNIRNIEIKLMVAYMATSGTDLKECTPGINSSTNAQDLLYGSMWADILAYYKKQGLDKMSNRAIKKLYMERLASDQDLRKTVDLWEQFGWTEHEHVRHERNSTATRWGVRAAFLGLAFLGVQLPSDV